MMTPKTTTTTTTNDIGYDKKTQQQRQSSVLNRVLEVVLRRILKPIFHFILYQLLVRPSFYVSIITCIAYWDTNALNGSFVYDDAGSIKTNIVVTGKVPWTDVFIRDFWGTLMTEPQSHKSFRPITTLSFQLNWMLAVRQLQHQYNTTEITASTINNMNMIPFHIVNVALHCAVTALVTEAAYYVFTTPSKLSIGELSRRQQPPPQQQTHISATPTTASKTSTTTIAQIITGSLFGFHPIHVEAVTNITSRGELFMSIFYLIAFLSYVQSIPTTRAAATTTTTTFISRIISLIGIYIIPCICMILSMFSKEQGATTLLTILAYDFIHHQYSIYQYCMDVYTYFSRNRSTTSTTDDSPPPPPPPQQQQLQQPNEPPPNEPREGTMVATCELTTHRGHVAIAFFRRAIVLLLQTIVVAYWRYWLNGITKPDFITDQNPAGFATARLTRLFSVPYVYCLYLYDYIYPMYLGPDWSGASIDLITSVRYDDVRVMSVVLLWIFTAICFYTLLFGKRQKQVSSSLSIHQQQQHQETRRIILISFVAFVFCPFLLSSNLLIVVGLMKADRVIYLPLMGMALLEALLVIRVFYPQGDDNDEKEEPATPNKISSSKRNKVKISLWQVVGNVLVLMQLSFFAAKLHERNVAWSHSLNLWTAAYNLNPRSKHTMYNCGYELSLQQRYVEAEYVLRPIGNPHVDGPSNTFIYAMVLQNMKRCEEAIELIELALEVVQEKRRAGGPRNSDSSLLRTKSNLLVAYGFCTMDTNIQLAGQRFYDAVQADPTNEYAVEQANKMVQRLEQLQLLDRQQQKAHLGIK